jgi:hypothetical protein
MKGRILIGGALVAAIVIACSPVLAGAAAPTLSVSPAKGLHDGQTITVTFMAVTGQATVLDTVAQCMATNARDYAGDPSKDCQPYSYVPVSVAPNVGDGDATFQVKSTDSHGNPCNTSDNICTISVRPDFNTFLGSVSMPITFGVAATSASAAKSTKGSSGSSSAPVVVAVLVLVLGLAVLVRQRMRRTRAGSPLERST